MEGVNVSQNRAEQLAGQCEVYLAPESGYWVRTDNLSSGEYTRDIYRTGDQQEEIPAEAVKVADRN